MLSMWSPMRAYSALNTWLYCCVEFPKTCSYIVEVPGIFGSFGLYAGSMTVL